MTCTMRRLQVAGLTAFSLAALFDVQLIAENRPRSTTGSPQDRKPLYLYVSPKGNNSWSGTLAEVNGAKTDGPLATIEAARDAIRHLRESGSVSSAVTVYLRGGQYQLSEPIIFAPEDSGTPEAPITYAAYSNEAAVVNGGREIHGWKKSARANLYEARVPGVKEGRWYFHELFVNGHRRQRARSPNSGFYHVDGDLSEGEHAQFRYHSNEILAGWDKSGDAEVVILQSWTVIRGFVLQVNADRHSVTISQRQVGTREWGREHNARYWVENTLEALDSPGEWYLDRHNGMLYYWPMQDEDLTHDQVIVPALKELVRFQAGVWGDSDPGTNGWPLYPVHDIRLVGLTFEYADWSIPPDGHTEKQSAFDIPAAIEAVGANSIELEKDSFKNLGAYAIEFGKGCHENQIVRNEMMDLGAGGVKLGEPKVPNTLNESTARNRVTNNRIHDIGKVFLSAPGIWVGQSSDNLIAHNEIYNTYQIGISVRWTWDFLPTTATNNTVEFNNLHDIGRGMSGDLGCIYTVGVQGAVIRNNICHDVSRFEASYGGWGLYTDEGSTDVLLENNLVYNTQDAAFHQNLANRITLRNNIFALGKTEQIARQIHSGSTDRDWTTFEHNVVYWKNGELLSMDWDDSRFKFDGNLYYNPDPSAVRFGKLSFEQWQKLGRDQNSIVSDPRFVDAGRFDFTLTAESPARKVGFKPIDFSSVGPTAH